MLKKQTLSQLTSLTLEEGFSSLKVLRKSFLQNRKTMSASPPLTKPKQLRKARTLHENEEGSKRTLELVRALLILLILGLPDSLCLRFIRCRLLPEESKTIQGTQYHT